MVSADSSKTLQITKFTTSSFDPRWAGEDKIVFASYENGGISVRLLNNVPKLIDTPVTVKQLSFGDVNKQWSFSKLKGVDKKKYT